MNTRHALLAFALFGCSTDGAAEAALIEEGYTDVSLEREGAGTFKWVGRQGDSVCHGSIDITSLPGYRKAKVNALCEASLAEQFKAVEEAHVEAEPELELEPEVAKPETPRAPGLRNAKLFPDLSYPGASVKISHDGDPASRAAVPLLQALAAGDRAWIAKRGNPALRRAIASDVFTPLGIAVKRLGEARLELVSQRTSTNDYEVTKFRLVGHGGTTIDVTTEVNDDGFGGLLLQGEGMDELRAGIQGTTPSLRVYSTYYFVDGRGVLASPDDVRDGERLEIRLAMGRAAVADGHFKVSFSMRVTCGGTPEKINVAPTKLEGDGFFHVNAFLTNPKSDRCDIALSVKDETTGNVLEQRLELTVA